MSAKSKHLKKLVKEEIQRVLNVAVKEAHVQENSNDPVFAAVEAILEKITRSGENRLNAYLALIELLKAAEDGGTADRVRRWVEADWVNWFGEEAPAPEGGGMRMPDARSGEHWLGPRE